MACFLPFRIESYIPGAALLLGFYQENERNAKQEVSASFVVASSDSVDVKIKFPEVLEETFTTYFFMQNVCCIYMDVSSLLSCH